MGFVDDTVDGGVDICLHFRQIYQYRKSIKRSYSSTILSASLVLH